MITGAHSIIYSTDPEKDRKFFRDILKFPFIDAGDGWLIFGLPRAEFAIHPSKKNDIHELFLTCDDIEDLVRQMKITNIECGKVERLSWGLLVKVKLPGGGYVKIYEPLHGSPSQGV